MYLRQPSLCKTPFSQIVVRNHSEKAIVLMLSINAWSSNDCKEYQKELLFWVAQ